MKKIHIFLSTNGVSGIKNFKCKFSGFLCHICGLIRLSSWLFLWFVICGLVQVSFLILVVSFNFSIAIFLSLLLE
jgi:hypothetical protein